MVKGIKFSLVSLGRNGIRVASQLFQEKELVAVDIVNPGNNHSNRRPKRRELFCPKHPDQRIEGNGKKYFLHLLTQEELRARGMSDKKAKLVISAYPVFVLSNEWLEELFCPQCGTSSWCHVVKHDRINHTVEWAPRELWMQVAHVDPLMPNPSVSEFTRRASRQLTQKRVDGKQF
jgi:hypothetical protein